MILLLNCFITHSMNPYARGYMHRDDNFEILLYTISSLAAVDRWSHAIFRVRLDAQYAHRAQELTEYIHREFDPICPRVEVADWRNERQSQWREEALRLEEEADPYVWYLCNHDHVFMDYDHEALDAALAALDADPEPRKSIYYSHWPEFNRTIQNGFPHDFRMLPCGTLAGRWNVMDSIQIVSKPLLHSWWVTPDYGDKYVPRSDWQDVYATEPYRVLVPYREICKHYDGYSHLFDEKVVAPLAIPPGFFEKDIKVRWGFTDYREGWVNVNPQLPYKSATPDGVDYRWGSPEDIPQFWWGRIALIDKHPDWDHSVMLSARNQAVRDYMTCYSHHQVLGGKMPTEEYIRRSLR